MKMRETEVIEWTKSLKKGDEVAVYHHGTQTAKTKVERITPSGRIIVSGGSTYLPNGSPFGKMADSSRSIRPVTK